MKTRTGKFSIGFRRGWSDWQKDLPALADWAAKQGFETIDLQQLRAGDVETLSQHRLRLGSVDLLDFGRIAQPGAGAAAQLREANIAYIRRAAEWGARRFFTIIGGESSRSRADNYRAAVEAFAPLAEAAAAVGGMIAVEGYPGDAPHYALLCTTPETCRAFLKDIPRGLGLNYDPSHLIRLGVDHIRFLREFVGSVVHVHAKDAVVMPEAVYEMGLYQPSAFKEPHQFGQHVWRYTLPGEGSTDWPAVLAILRDNGYQGPISVELEDENFNGKPEGEKAGFTRALKFLESI